MKYYSLFILIIVTTLYSCKSNEVILTEGNYLQMKEIYTQKVVPGQKEMKTKDFLFISFNTYDTDTYLIDSIYYLNKVYLIQKNRLKYKIDLNTGVDAKNKEHTDSSKNNGTIFYHQNKKLFYKKLSDIKRKETLYMP
jgi:hypothetical protein